LSIYTYEIQNKEQPTYMANLPQDFITLWIDRLLV